MSEAPLRGRVGDLCTQLGGVTLGKDGVLEHVVVALLSPRSRRTWTRGFSA